MTESDLDRAHREASERLAREAAARCPDIARDHAWWVSIAGSVLTCNPLATATLVEAEARETVRGEDWDAWRSKQG